MVEIDEKLEISDIHILEENDQLEIIFEEELIESCFVFCFFHVCTVKVIFFRSSRPEVIFKKVFLEISQNS